MKQWLEPDEIRSLHREEKNDSLQLLDRIKTIYYNIIVTLLKKKLCIDCCVC